MKVKFSVICVFLISFINDALTEVDSSYYYAINTKMYAADSIMLSYRKTNPDSALIFAREVLYHAKLIKDTGSVDYAHMHLGSLNRVKGNLDSAIWYYNLALDSYKHRNFEEGIASVYNNLATIYKLQSRYDLAIKNYHEALEIFKNTTNFQARANLYSNFAGLYFKLENLQKAKELWSRAKEDYAKANDWIEITHTYRGFAKIALAENELTVAQNYLDKAVSLDLKNRMDVFLLEDYLLLMQTNLAINSLDDFLNVKNKIVDLNLLDEMKFEKSKFLTLIGNYHFIKNEFNQSVNCYNESLLLIQDVEFDEESLMILKKLLPALIKLKSNDDALKTLKNIETLELIVAEKRKDRLTQEYNATFELADKEERINLLTEKNNAIEKLAKTEQELKERKGRQLTISFFVIVIILLLFIYIVLILRKQIRIQKQLKVALTENEVLFKELNHRVKNNLHIVGGFLGIEMYGRSEEVVAILKTCERRIQSLGHMHELLYQNHVAGSINVIAYFTKLKNTIQKSLLRENDVLLVEIDEKISLDTNRIVLLGLIVNELITNSVKHARIEEQQLVLKVNLTKTSSNFKLTISDNGKGFMTENKNLGNAIGMKLANGLAIQLGGKLQRINISTGTQFEIQF